MAGEMAWIDQVLHLRLNPHDRWQPYTAFPGLSVADHPIPRGSKGYATMQKLLRSGWIYASKNHKLIARIQSIVKNANRTLLLQKTIDQAECFAKSLPSLEEYNSPIINLGNDGEICFYWDCSGFILDLGVDGSNHYSYYAKLPNGQEIVQDKVKLSQPLPHDILQAIIHSNQKAH